MFICLFKNMTQITCLSCLKSLSIAIMGCRKQHIITQAQNFQKNNRETSPETLGNTITTPVPQLIPDYNSDTTSNKESDDDEITSERDLTEFA